MGKAKRLLVLDTIRRKDLPKDVIAKATAEAKYIAEHNLARFRNHSNINRTGGSRAKYGPELIKEFQEET
jgi:hypothetical protein